MLQKLRPFAAHGFEQVGESGDEVYGLCPFCGKNKFYINVRTGQFSCKVCDEHGNMWTFLARVAEMHLANTSPEQYTSLSENRGISKKVLKKFGLAWDGEKWLIPCQGQTGAVHDLRHWRGKAVQSTAGCATQLLGAFRLSQFVPGGRVFVCEGEWDSMALYGALLKAGEEDWVTTAVPGAGTFRDAWAELFRGQHVILCYDNDDPGRRGARKAIEKIGPYALDIKCIDWGSQSADGYDVRDWFLEKKQLKAKRAIEKFLLMVKRPPDSPVVVEKKEQQASAGEPEKVVPGTVEDVPSYDEVIDVFDRWVEMSDSLRTALWLCLAHAFSPSVGDRGGSQIWCYIVGPSGCGKTLLLEALRGSDRCRYVSSLGPKNLVSGYRSSAGDPSVLPQWSGRCAILKDFTEILATHPKSKEELYGTLRGAYDGSVERRFGNGIVRSYHELNFSLLAGATAAIHGDKQAMMGERFLKYQIRTDLDETATILRAMDNTGSESEMRRELCDVVGRFLARDSFSIPEVSQKYKLRLVRMAQLVALLRSNVDRERYGAQDPRYEATPEIGTRLAKQLLRLGMCLAIVKEKTKFNEEIMGVIRSVAFDTAHGFSKTVAQVIHDQKEVSRGRLCEITELPETTIGRVLEDLRMVKVVERYRAESTGPGQPKFYWKLTDYVKGLWETVLKLEKTDI